MTRARVGGGGVLLKSMPNKPTNKTNQVREDSLGLLTTKIPGKERGGEKNPLGERELRAAKLPEGSCPG